MDAPALVLVPPTPLKFTHSASPSPSSTDTATSSSPRFSVVEQARTSSETTIFSIYSMYGDDQQAQNRWSASGTSQQKQPHSRNSIPSVELTLPETLRESIFRSNGIPYKTDESEPSYSSSTPRSRPSSVKRLPPLPEKSFLLNNGIASQRPASSHATPSSLWPEQSDQRRASTGHSYRNTVSSTSSLSPGPSQPKGSPRPSSNNSRRSSRSSRIIHTSQVEDLSTDTPFLTPRQSTTPQGTPPRQPSPITTVDQLRTPPIPPTSYQGSPHSIVSLVPSEGEDVDAFHVRNTYAQLDASGVKGDGYEEGVERTRARVGNSRASQLNADAALGDGNEKNKDLDPKEIETLASLDRYGFFTIPSHDRLILLSSAPLLKRLTPASAGPANAPSHATSLKALPPHPLPLKEASRIAKWTRMLQPQTRDEGANIQTWSVRRSKESKLRERTYKGIPDRWRGAAWDLLMNRYANMGPREMRKLGQEFREALDKPSTYDIQIDLDVPRTISGHILFRTRYGAGQRSLFHVLHCFSLRCEQCGYVQGMGPIAATMLCYFEPERVYCSLVRLHDAYSMHTVFSPGFPGLLEAIFVQERITEQMMPDVYAAFKKHMISTTSYATKWYITLFANSVPFQTQLRLWDAFLLDGYDVFIAVAVAIVWVYRDHITASSANFETVLSLLSSFFVPEDENALLSWIEKTLGDKKLRSSISRWRQDWRALVASGKDGAALL